MGSLVNLEDPIYLSLHCVFRVSFMEWGLIADEIFLESLKESSWN